MCGPGWPRLGAFLYLGHLSSFSLLYITLQLFLTGAELVQAVGESEAAACPSGP